MVSAARALSQRSARIPSREIEAEPEPVGSLATLGEVCFRKGTVVWLAGDRGHPASPNVIGEDELRAGMRFLHPGPEAPGYNDPLYLIRAANFLQPLGKAKALAIVGEYARIHDVAVDETRLFLLLRTLFDVPRPLRHPCYSQWRREPRSQ